MDDQTPTTQIEQMRKPLLQLPAKPRVAEKAEDGGKVYYGLANNQVSLVDIEQGKVIFQTPQMHQHKIGCMRNKQNLLMTGGYDHTVKLFDPRSGNLVHTFQKIPGNFNSVDKTQHIMAAANNSNIVFWDLRKMKQRSEFKDSFDGEITFIRFQDTVPTNLMGCSINGMINLFDLTQPNEEDAFSWCFKIMESPNSFALTHNGTALVQTIDHVVYKVQDGDHLGKITPNNPENPKHVVCSDLKQGNGSLDYSYCTWSPQEAVIELWGGNFHDRDNRQRCYGYINGIPDLQIFTRFDRLGLIADERGNLYTDSFEEEKRINYSQKQTFCLPPQATSFLKNHQKREEVQPGPQMNKNGYLLERPKTLIRQKPKFRPY